MADFSLLPWTFTCCFPHCFSMKKHRLNECTLRAKLGTVHTISKFRISVAPCNRGGIWVPVRFDNLPRAAVANHLLFTRTSNAAFSQVDLKGWPRKEKRPQQGSPRGSVGRESVDPNGSFWEWRGSELFLCVFISPSPNHAKSPGLQGKDTALG